MNRSMCVAPLQPRVSVNLPKKRHRTYYERYVPSRRPKLESKAKKRRLTCLHPFYSSHASILLPSRLLKGLLTFALKMRSCLQSRRLQNALSDTRCLTRALKNFFRLTCSLILRAQTSFCDCVRCPSTILSVQSIFVARNTHKKLQKPSTMECVRTTSYCACSRLELSRTTWKMRMCTSTCSAHSKR